MRRPSHWLVPTAMAVGVIAGLGGINTPVAGAQDRTQSPGATGSRQVRTLESSVAGTLAPARTAAHSSSRSILLAQAAEPASSPATQPKSTNSRNRDAARDLEPAVDTSRAPASAMEQTVDTSVAPPPSVLEPAVDTSAPPDPQSEAGAANASNQRNRATGNQANAAQKGRTTTRSGQAMDRLDLDSTQITGNRELPKVLYIVPWKRSDLGDLLGKPVNSLLDEVLTPVDRDVFKRENRYFNALETSGAPPAGAAGASSAPPAK